MMLKMMGVGFLLCKRNSINLREIKVWTLVARPKKHFIIRTKWVFRNKVDEKGHVIRNKARLVAEGYNQEEGVTPLYV